MLPCHISLPTVNHVTDSILSVFIIRQQTLNSNKLCNIDWSLVYDASDVDEKYTCLLNIITDLHNTCFPLTSVKINPMKESKPWISLSILNSVKKNS